MKRSHADDPDNDERQNKIYATEKIVRQRIHNFHISNQRSLQVKPEFDEETTWPRNGSFEAQSEFDEEESEYCDLEYSVPKPRMSASFLRLVGHKNVEKIECTLVSNPIPIVPKNITLEHSKALIIYEPPITFLVKLQKKNDQSNENNENNENKENYPK